MRKIKNMNVPTKASISIIDPDVASSLPERLSQTLERIRTQLRTRSSVGSPLPQEGRSVASSLSTTRDIHKLLVLARTREANLQDQIDDMKSEIFAKDTEISRLNQSVESLRRELDDIRIGSSQTQAELNKGIGALNDQLMVQSELYGSSIRRDCRGELSRVSTPPCSPKSLPRCVTPRDVEICTTVLNHRVYRPTSSPIRLSSSYIPDISRHFRNARVVSDADPLFRALVKS
jgi:hypothetical protein